MRHNTKDLPRRRHFPLCRHQVFLPHRSPMQTSAFCPRPGVYMYGAARQKGRTRVRAPIGCDRLVPCNYLPGYMYGTYTQQNVKCRLPLFHSAMTHDTFRTSQRGHLQDESIEKLLKVVQQVF